MACPSDARSRRQYWLDVKVCPKAERIFEMGDEGQFLGRWATPGLAGRVRRSSMTWGLRLLKRPDKDLSHSRKTMTRVMLRFGT